MSKNWLLMNDEMIKVRTTIHGNIDPKLIYPEIKVAQDFYIHPILGSSLFNKLLVDVNASGITGDYKTLLDDYIVDPLMYYAIAQLPMGISFQFWNKGVIRKQGDSTELPTMSELMDISNHYRMRAEKYAGRLTNYLQQHSSTTFLPEYLTACGDLDSIGPQSSPFTMPIYLGHHHHCHNLDINNCHCNE